MAKRSLTDKQIDKLTKDGPVPHLPGAAASGLVCSCHHVNRLSMSPPAT